MSKLDQILKKDWEMSDYDSAVLKQQIKDLMLEIANSNIKGAAVGVPMIDYESFIKEIEQL